VKLGWRQAQNPGSPAAISPGPKTMLGPQAIGLPEEKEHQAMAGAIEHYRV
jgi:hypothetical protein